MLSCATSCLAAGEGARGQSAGGPVAVALTADVPHSAGVQRAVAAKQLTAENQHIQTESTSLSPSGVCRASAGPR